MFPSLAAVCGPHAQGRRNKFKSGGAKRGSGGCTPSGDPRGRAPWWGSGAKPPEVSAFSKMRLEFVHQVDGTIITKLLTKSLYFFSFFKAEKWYGQCRIGRSASDAPAHANERKARGLTPTTSAKCESECQLLAKLFLLIWKVNSAVSKTKSQ